LKVTREKTEDSQVFLTVEMESTEVEASLEHSYNSLVKKVKIPGFRQGKAPRVVLERYIGKESLLEDALNSLIPESYEKAIKEQEIEAIAQPQIEVTQTDPVVFKAIVPLKPIVELGDYVSIRLKPEPVQPTENDSDQAIEQLRHSLATWDPVDREVGLGDLVNLDVQSEIESEPFINQKGAQYQVLSEMPFPAPGFAEQLLGMKLDEEKEFKLQFPSDFPRTDLGGKEVSFEVKITEIKQEELPELNDEFAKQIDTGFENMDSLREQVIADLKLKMEEKAKADFEELVIEEVVNRSQWEFPPVLVEEEISRVINERTNFQRSAQSLETYLKSINKSEQELREEIHPVAVKRVSWSLVLQKVAEEEKIEVSTTEIEEEIQNLTNSSTERKDEIGKLFNTPQAKESIKQRLIVRKTVMRLVEIAKGSEDKEGSDVK
jgi:trigger factor